MYRITEPATVAAVLADFEKDWEEAELLTQPLINTMLENAEKHKREREKSRSTSRSQSKDRDVYRSLSAEQVEEAQSEDDDEAKVNFGGLL